MHLYGWCATNLHLLGLDHEKLTYRLAGRDFRLTDVDDSVAKGRSGNQPHFGKGYRWATEQHWSTLPISERERRFIRVCVEKREAA